MITRLLPISSDYSILLLGPRGSGKSTLIQALFPPATTYKIDLLNPELEQEFSLNPQELAKIVAALPKSISHVIIDEVQKIPKLLDVVHSLLESKHAKIFVLTGSSARKLKRGGANLLAGRAFVFHLFPFTFLEQGEAFSLSETLHYGQLPRVVEFTGAPSKVRFLQSYVNTYLKEEVAAEQLVKKLEPFRRFLEVAAQSNGKIINFSNIAKDTGVSDNTIREYFSILEDTLVGFFLEPFSGSFRKRLGQKPKFYFFDIGVVRALSRVLSLPLLPQTSAYGDAFEHFVILEIYRLLHYFNPEYRISYLHTKDDEEIDIIVERPGQSMLAIEIKSAESITEAHLTKTLKLTKGLSNAEALCFYNGSSEKQYEGIRVMPWAVGITRYFGPPSNEN
jgi:predicted AAA+ superfamily ATPase